MIHLDLGHCSFHPCKTGPTVNHDLIQHYTWLLCKKCLSWFGFYFFLASCSFMGILCSCGQDGSGPTERGGALQEEGSVHSSRREETSEFRLWDTQEEATQS